MEKVIVSCDSVSVLPEVARKYGFTMIPCIIILDGKQYLDTEIDMDELYARLDAKENLPKTSTANVEEILQYFAELSPKAEAIIHICMSSIFSKQYSNILKAKELAGERLPGAKIEVVDSRTIGIGISLIAIEGAKIATNGGNVNDVMEHINYVIPRINELTARDTLFYYDKGGRIFEARSWAEAELASSFRSIVEADASTGGIAKPVARAKTSAQILDKLVEITKEKAASGNKLRGTIGYTRGAAERAEKLKETMLSEVQFDLLFTAEESASSAVHNGRMCIDYAFCSE